MGDTNKVKVSTKYVGRSILHYLSDPKYTSEPRRNSLEIIEDILRVAAEGTCFTKIMYGANLNFVRAKRYINFLLAEGLLSMEGGSRKKIYRTTERGQDFIRSFLELRTFITKTTSR